MDKETEDMKNLCQNMKKEIEKNEIVSFLIVFFTGLIMYYQMPSNWLTNPDGVWNSIYFRMGHGGEKKNGRLFQIVVDKLRMNMVTPVFTTAVCVLLLALTACIVWRIFESKNTFVNVLIGMILLFVPCTSSSLTYYYCADSFMLAFLCVVLGVYLIRKHPAVRSSIAAVILFVSSLYLYQAYICVVFVLAVLLLIKDILENRKSFKETMVGFGVCAATSGIAMVLYMVSFKVIQVVLHMEVRADRGLDFKNLFGENGLITLMKEAYINFYQYFFGNRLINNGFGERNLINLLVFAALFTAIAAIFIKNRLWKSAAKTAVLCAGILALPLAAEAITVMSPKVDEYGPTGIIMIPTMAFIYIFVPVAGENLAGKMKLRLFGVAATAVSILFLWNSVVFTNLCINSMKLNLNKAETVADLMLEDIIEEAGYEKGMKLLVAGSMEDGNFPSLYEWPTDAIKGSSASYGFMWDTYTGNENCWVEFMKQYKGIRFTACDQTEYESLLSDKEYQDMPLFPADGSVKVIGETVVVKMSDVELE